MDKIKINTYQMVERIDKILSLQGRTRDNLAAFIGKNRQVFTDWKNANIVPKSDDLYNMSIYLGVTMEYLLFGDVKDEDDLIAAKAMLSVIPKDKRQPIIAMIQSQVEYWKNQQ